MNRLLILYGCVLLSSTAIAAIQGSPFEWTPVNEMEQDIALYENKATTSNWHGHQSHVDEPGHS